MPEPVHVPSLGRNQKQPQIEMNIRAIHKIFAAIIDISIYFFIFRSLSRFWIMSDKIHVSNLIFDFGILIVFLSGVTYTGSWLTISERKYSTFWKAFIAFDILPGILVTGTGSHGVRGRTGSGITS
jgi:hypothetical protein